MSRLADAHAKLDAALQQLEVALANWPAPDNGAAHANDTLDRAAIIAEIGRIDAQLSSVMQMIDHARTDQISRASVSRASGSEGGTA